MTEEEKKNLESQIALEVRDAIDAVIKKYEDQGYKVKVGVDDQYQLRVLLED